MPLPSPDLCGKEIATLARSLALRELNEGTTAEYAEARSQLDALATEAYGITPKEFETILADFDLLVEPKTTCNPRGIVLYDNKRPCQVRGGHTVRTSTFTHVSLAGSH